MNTTPNLMKHFSMLLLPILAASASAQTPPLTPPDSSASAPAASPSTSSTAPSPAPSPAPAGSNSKKKHGIQIPKIGIDLDAFLPSSGKTRSRFGNDWGGIGIGIGRPDRPSGTGRISFEFSSEYKKSGDHHAFVAPIGVSYRRAFSADALTNGSKFIPYYGVSADLVAADLRSVEDNVHSGFRLAAGGSALVGTTIGASGFAEAKYLAVSKVKGFDLSGIKLSVGVRF